MKSFCSKYSSHKISSVSCFSASVLPSRLRESSNRRLASSLSPFCLAVCPCDLKHLCEKENKSKAKIDQSSVSLLIFGQLHFNSQIKSVFSALLWKLFEVQSYQIRVLISAPVVSRSSPTLDFPPFRGR